MYHGAEYYWQGKSKAFNFFAAVPFGLTATEQNAWIYHGGGQELWDELAAGFDIKPFMAANTGVQMGGWFAKEVNTLDDYKGLKFRMPGIGGEVLRRLGAAVVNLPGGEIFAALQSGRHRRHRVGRSMERPRIRVLQGRQVLLLARVPRARHRPWRRIQQEVLGRP